MSHLCLDDDRLAVSSHCRGFDFTLMFEQLILCVIPQATFFVTAAVCVALKRGLKAEAVKLTPSLFVALSMLFSTALANLLALIAWVISPPNLSSLSIHITTGAFALSFVSSLLQTYLGWRTSVSRSSAFYLSLCISVTILLDAPRVRTFVLVRAEISTFFLAYFLLQYGLRLASLVSLNFPQAGDSAEGAGFLSQLFALWAFPLIWRGRKGNLRIEDMPSLDRRMNSPELYRKFNLAWVEYGHTSIGRQADSFFQSNAGHPLDKRPSSISRALFVAFYPILLGPIIPAVVRALAQGLQPILVKKSIQFIASYSSASPQPSTYGWALAGAFAIVFVVIAGTTGLYYSAVYRAGECLRGTLIEVIYRKALVLSAASANSDGQRAVNLMSGDIERIINNLDPFHQLYASFFVIGLSLYILYDALGVAFLAAVFTTTSIVIFLPIISRPVGPRSTAFGALTDKRIRLISGLIRQIKGVKLSGCESVAIKKVQEARLTELKGINKFWNRMSIVVCLTNVTSNMMSLLTLGTFSILSVLRNGSDSLTTARLFTAYAVINIVSSQMLLVGQYYPGVINSYRSLKRIEDYLNSPETPTHSATTTSTTESVSGINDQLVEKFESERLSQQPSGSIRTVDASDSSVSRKTIASIKSHHATSSMDNFSHEPQPVTAIGDESLAAFTPLQSVVFTQTTIGWGKQVVLKCVSTEISSSRTTMVVGRVASGKSTFLASLLRETTLISGSLSIPWSFGSVAYCSQKPWLQKNKSIAQNITFASDMDVAWYDIVVRACALDVDFSSIVGGDSALAATTSGGQQARVALARAVYSKRDVVILDDVFCALDGSTSAFVFDALFGNDGLLRQKTVILSTNQVSHLRSSHWIVVLDRSTVAEQGTYSDLLQSDTTLGSLLREGGSDLYKNPVLSSIGESSPDATNDSLASPSGDVEQVRVGVSGRQIYRHYFLAAGHHHMIIYAALLLLTIGIQTAIPAYLQIWAAHNDILTNDTQGQRDTLIAYLSGYAAFETAFSIALSALFYFVIMVVTPAASANLHSQQLIAVLEASFDFFNTTSAGQIISRFSQDFTIIDSEVPLALYDVSYQSLGLVGSAILLILSVPYLAIVLVVVSVLGYFVQKLYLATSRPLRRLELESKSPLYTLLQETVELNGLFTIRAFAAEAHVVASNTHLLSRAQKPFHGKNVARIWLVTMIALMTAIINMALIITAVITRNSTKAGALGVGITQAVALQEAINLMLISWTQLEIAVVALERSIEYCRLEPEESVSRGAVEPKGNWPSNGKIEFLDLTARYTLDASPALNSISFSASPGHKIGICGRTGSGKSTMILALLRALHLQGEIRIDGESITDVPLRILRKNISTVVQDTFILQGLTVRENLDVEGGKPDDELWRVLEAVQLKSAISAFEARLDQPLSSIGVELSQGQMQLLALARAILQGNKILILDEATANLDIETDQTVQQVITSTFAGCTVIVVAHRIWTIADYDQVIVLDQGEVVEMGPPRLLLRQPNSVLAQLAAAQ